MKTKKPKYLWAVLVRPKKTTLLEDFYQGKGFSWINSPLVCTREAARDVIKRDVPTRGLEKNFYTPVKVYF